jgi:hypothetical protein
LARIERDSCASLVLRGEWRGVGNAPILEGFMSETAQPVVPANAGIARHDDAIAAGPAWLHSALGRMTRVLSFLVLGLAACATLWFIPGGRLWVAETLVRVADSGSNEKAYQTVVRPATDWARQFHRDHHRLPTRNEVDAHATDAWPGFSVSIYDTQPQWQRSWGQFGVDFMVCVHTGEWNLYRQSWDGREFKAWTD